LALDSWQVSSAAEAGAVFMPPSSKYQREKVKSIETKQGSASRLHDMIDGSYCGNAKLLTLGAEETYCFPFPVAEAIVWLLSK
jgi:hypothetical protein